MIKIAEVQPKGVARMTVYYDKAATNNPYKVYLEFKELTQYGLLERRHQLNRYADLASGVAEMARYALQNNEEGR